MTDMSRVIRVQDIRAAEHCMRGARTWFDYHGLSWNDFLKNGITVEQALGTGDALAVRIVTLTEPGND